MVSELQVVSSQVPAKIEELVQFVKVGRECNGPLDPDHS